MERTENTNAYEMMPVLQTSPEQDITTPIPQLQDDVEANVPTDDSITSRSWIKEWGDKVGNCLAWGIFFVILVVMFSSLAALGMLIE